MRGVLLILKTFIGVGTAALVLGTVVSVKPGLSLLLVPGLKSASPYCTVWSAVNETGVKLQQHRLAQKIGSKTRLVRAENGLKLWSTPQGEFWVPASSDKILPLLLAQQERQIYGPHVKPGDVVIDAGAHVGTFAKKALAEGAKLVVAIDPSPAAVECLRRNLRAEIAAAQVIVVPEGVWDKADALELFDNGKGNAGDSFLKHAAGAKSVPGIRVRPIDAMVAELKLERVDVIKADVKGATEKAIAGAGQTIARWKPRLVFSTEERPEDAGSITRLVQKLEGGYKLSPGPCVYDGREIRSETVAFVR